MALSQKQLERLSSYSESGTPAVIESEPEKSRLGEAGARVVSGGLKLIEQFQRPYYGITNVLKDVADKGDFSPVRSLYRGVTLQDKPEFGDVLTEFGWKPETMVGKVSKGVVSFVGSVALDPATYLTGGASGVLRFGSKFLNQKGANLFLKRLSKHFGKKLKSVDDIGKYSGMKGFNEAYEKAGKEILEVVHTLPDQYSNKAMLRFMGKELPKATDALRGAFRPVRKAMKPLLNTRIGRETAREGRFVGKTLGDIFSPGYSIRNSRHLTHRQKAKALVKLEADRSKGAWQELKDIHKAKVLFKGMNKEQKANITYQVEKLLKYGQKEKTETVINRIIKQSKGQEVKQGVLADYLIGKKLKSGQIARTTPFSLIEQDDYSQALLLARKIKAASPHAADKSIVRQTMSEIRVKVASQTYNEDGYKKILGEIKDEKTRKLVATVTKKMDELYKDEVRAGVRKPGGQIKAGFVPRRMKKALYPEDVNAGYHSRGKDALNIKKRKELYRKGEADFYFEEDIAKLLATRSHEAHTKIIRKQSIDWFEKQSFLKAYKGEKFLEKGMTKVDLWGKNYMAYPEIARELKRISPKLKDPGMSQFWKTYDRIQNAWKLSVTSLWPSFHARNAVSNVWLGWLGGNTNPKNYILAGKLHMYGHKIKKGKKVTDEVITLGQRKFKLSELWEMGGDSGVIGTGRMGKDYINKLTTSKKEIEYYFEYPRRFGTAVENYARASLFFDRLAKGDDTFSAAAHAKKFLFDYGDLTPTEKEVFKRVVPFYTWLRKSIGLNLEQVAMQPGKYAGMFHLKAGVESMTTAEEEKYLPEWLREEEMTVRLPGKRYLKPDLPFQDLAKLTLSDKAIKEFVGSISPLIKGVFEVAANKDIFRGKPLADQRLPKDRLALEKIKQELINNLRAYNMYDKATDIERGKLEKFIDIVLGIKTYEFDSQLGKVLYRKRKIGEQRALRKLEQKNK